MNVVRYERYEGRCRYRFLSEMQGRLRRILLGLAARDQLVRVSVDGSFRGPLLTQNPHTTCHGAREGACRTSSRHRFWCEQLPLTRLASAAGLLCYFDRRRRLCPAVWVRARSNAEQARFVTHPNTRIDDTTWAAAATWRRCAVNPARPARRSSHLKEARSCEFAKSRSAARMRLLRPQAHDWDVFSVGFFSPFTPPLPPPSCVRIYVCVYTCISPGLSDFERGSSVTSFACTSLHGIPP